VESLLDVEVGEPHGAAVGALAQRDHAQRQPRRKCVGLAILDPIRSGTLPHLACSRITVTTTSRRTVSEVEGAPSGLDSTVVREKGVLLTFAARFWMPE
jgi:hypothetical protein